MGRKLVLTGTKLTDVAAPRLVNVDPIESVGSLLLLDATHPVQAWDAGVPATMPNLFADTLGTGASCAVEVAGAINDGTKGMIERSGKGGIHAIVSKATALAAGDGLAVRAPLLLASYPNANKDHTYYMSVWRRVTRRTGPGTSEQGFYFGMCAAYNHGYGIGGARPSYWTGIGAKIADRVEGATQTGVFLTNQARVNATNDMPSTHGVVMLAGAPPNTINGVGVINQVNTFWESTVFYRVYIEDLTVSGRTYAELDAIDLALFQKEVLAEGGRYYDDTFTDPATIP